MELNTEILIIGGGASGMAAAVAAAEMGAEVTVAEANAAACVIREMVSAWRLRPARRWKAISRWKRQHRRLRVMMR